MITQPYISVWAVLGLDNGDVVAAGSDALIRIFSKDETRQAPNEDILTFDSLVSSSRLPSNQVGDLNKEKVDGPESLAYPGSKEGEVKMIRNGNIVEAYQVFFSWLHLYDKWNGDNLEWQKIGEVVDAISSNRKKFHDGKEYDYVFDVDIKDGAPSLKLPYNIDGIGLF